MKKIVQRILNTLGYEVHKYPGEELRRRRDTLIHLSIDTVFDVGANIGQYSLELRDIGYRGRIHSFEPMNDVFKKLQLVSANDINWTVYNHAMGSSSGSSVIYVAGNSFSSSIREMLPQHEQAAPESAIVRQMEIQVRTVDEVFPSLTGSGERCFLKVDTQGFESEVLRGAENSLNRFLAVQLEMSTVPLYKGQALYEELVAIMKDRGFTVHSLEPGMSDPQTGKLLQLDGLFINRALAS